MALTAVVTGASGYLAGEVIHQLLSKGYNVRGTVTNVEDRRKTGEFSDDSCLHCCCVRLSAGNNHYVCTSTGPLLALRRALPGKLTLTEADLFEPGSFDDVVKGADFVYHTASNVIFDSSNPEVRAVPTAPLCSALCILYVSWLQLLGSAWRTTLLSDWTSLLQQH